MVEDLRALAELARIDDALHVREQERAGLPAARAACAKRRSDCEARVSELRVRLDELRQLQRRHESDAQDQEAVLARLTGQQHQVKTNEAYTALLHEMDAAREAISNAETAVLEVMESLDAGQAELEADEASRDEALAEVARDETGLDARERELGEQISALQDERRAVAAPVADRVLAAYERVAGRRRPAIAVVSREICAGCRVGIPPQDYLEVSGGQSLVSCDQCSRILIHAQHLA